MGTSVSTQRTGYRHRPMMSFGPRPRQIGTKTITVDGQPFQVAVYESLELCAQRLGLEQELLRRPRRRRRSG